MKPDRRNPRESTPPGGRVVVALFGAIFAGIGFTVLVFLWSASWNDFGSPPLFFRVFGSFIALSFVVMGGFMVFSAIAAGNMNSESTNGYRNHVHQQDDPQDNSNSAAAVGYVCPRCSAPLAESAEVSPHGDVKCSYCNCWFNVHEK